MALGSYLAVRTAICNYELTGHVPEDSPPQWDWQDIRNRFFISSWMVPHLLNEMLKRIAIEPDASVRKSIVEAATEVLKRWP